MSYLYHIPMLPAATVVIASLIGLGGPEAGAQETGADSRFEEHPVEFRNQDINLAGSLLLPRSEVPLPAVVFVHGAGRHTRESQREVAEHFASQGIAALIYDKRGTGESGGAYESHRPYENLVKDALSAVAFLKQRHEIAQSQIGIWGLSQGGYISAAAASRTEDIKFVIAVGTTVADGSMFYYRDNLFRLYGLSDSLRDVAEKAHLAERDLDRTLNHGIRLSAFAPRSYPSPDKYLDPAWSHVDQPVLAMWGQLDQNVPVGESVAGLKNSLAHADNEKWTVVILPKTNHDLGISETGALRSKWLGYSPGALRTMTDWVRSVIDDPPQVDSMKQEGIAPETGVLSKLARYERLRWYGNAPVQAALWILFFIVFLANTMAGALRFFPALFRRQQIATLQASNRVVNFKQALCALNLLILAGLTITILSVLEQVRPSCPSILLFLPLLGTISTLATVAVLIVLSRTRRDHDWTVTRRVRGSLEISCLILFVPFMLYWNLIGYHF